jgi:hypothetical protein
MIDPAQTAAAIAFLHTWGSDATGNRGAAFQSALAALRAAVRSMTGALHRALVAISADIGVVLT